MVSKKKNDVIQKAISFYYLLAWCPNHTLKDFLKSTEPLRQQMAADLGSSREKLTDMLLPEIGEHIISFHTDQRQADENLVRRWVENARKAEHDPQSLQVYKNLMERIAVIPARAKEEKRLHRKKGCRFCRTACCYGYFSLTSEPGFELLQRILGTEIQRNDEEKSSVRAAWSYTAGHIMQITGSKKGFISADHLGNLSYCLLMLAMARSRYPLPEEQIRLFQFRNQRTISSFQK